MVSFKKLLFVASILVSGIAAVPTAVVERDLAGIEKRDLHDTRMANDIRESEIASAATVKDNGYKAKVTDLTGCTGVFFFMEKTLRSVGHIFCGNERADAEWMAKNAGGATSVTIGANTQTNYDNAVDGVHAAKPNLTINPQPLYTIPADKGKAATLFGESGTFTLVVGEEDKPDKEVPS